MRSTRQIKIYFSIHQPMIFRLYLYSHRDIVDVVTKSHTKDLSVVFVVVPWSAITFETPREL